MTKFGGYEIYDVYVKHPSPQSMVLTFVAVPPLEGRDLRRAKLAAVHGTRSVSIMGTTATSAKRRLLQSLETDF